MRATRSGVTLEAPEELEPLTLPMEERVGLENQESLLPGGETAGKEQKGEVVAAGEARFLDLALEDDELLPEQRIFKQELRLGALQIEGEAKSGRGLR